jgi:short-subunit dehydrogenase
VRPSRTHDCCGGGIPTGVYYPIPDGPQFREFTFSGKTGTPDKTATSGGSELGLLMRKTNSGRVVVVTGASAGVGRATARAFAREGAHVGHIARDTEGLHVAAREIDQLGGKGLAVAGDVADPNQVEAAAARIEHELGPIEVWINNAMTTVFGRVSDVTPDEFKRATEVTYLGTVYGTMAALRRMLPRNAGSIIQIGSALAYRSIPLQAAYCGAKHAIAGFTDSLRSELIHDRRNIHLTMVQLPAMNTPQFTWCRSKMPNHPQPVPPIFQPEVAAERIVWASHHRRREIFVGAPTVIAIEANKLVPALGDYYLGRTGFDSQQTQEPVPKDRPDNLFEPLPGDFGAHGAFGRQAHEQAATTWLAEHKGITALAGAAALGALAIIFRK